MAKTGETAGLSEIAITDHYDPKFANPERDVSIDLTGYNEALNDIRKRSDLNIKVVCGLELGIQETALDDAHHAVKGFDYDFVLGSIHCADGLDIFSKVFYENRSAEDVFRAYYKCMYRCLQKFTDFDVLGHINCIERYAKALPREETYMDLVEKILKLLIENGKGIEFNTSCFRYDMGGRLIPAVEILTLYKSLGGQIITVGSDAHKSSLIGYKIKDAYRILESLGFQTISSFDHRKPIMQPLTAPD